MKFLPSRPEKHEWNETGPAAFLKLIPYYLLPRNHPQKEKERKKKLTR